MSSGKIIVNGHFRPQRVTGVQRYAWEILSELDHQNTAYSWVSPPQKIKADSLRQLWMQGVMPFKIPDDQILWSPTNIGPVFCENQVLTLHDIADQMHPEWFDSRYVQWRSFILPRLLKKVRQIITVSQFSKESIINHFPEVDGKVEVVYNGVRTEHFYPRGDKEINKLKQQLNLQKPFVLSVGSLDERKNIRGLVKAWKLLPDKIKEAFDLVITGESARKFSFTLKETPEESIRFTGYVKEDQLPALYSAATVFAYPSLFEGFGLPVLEAMACGTPVVTSNTTSLKELASNKALTVNPQEPQSIAEAIMKLVESEDMRMQYVNEGQAFAQSFGWDETARKTKKILEKAIT